MRDETNHIDELIKEVAIQNNIALSKDDPIMVLPTINRLLLKESELNQQLILKQFKEELENAFLSANRSACNNANAVINNATDTHIAQVKEAIEETLNQSLSIFLQNMNSEYTNMRRLAILTTISSLVTLSCFIGFFILK